MKGILELQVAYHRIYSAYDFSLPRHQKRKSKDKIACHVLRITERDLSLQTEIWEAVVDHISFQDMINILQCCRELHNIFDEDLLWLINLKV